MSFVLPIREHLKNVVRVKNPEITRYNCLRLDKNESTIPFPEDIIEKLREEITAEFLMVYPELDPLYEKIARWLGCDVKNLYLASGSDGAIKTSFEAFVNPGDKVVILDPTYAMFPVYCRLFQAEKVPISFGRDLKLSALDVISVIRKNKPKLVCIANPNSPTGTAFPLREIDEIVGVGKEQGSVVMIDEAYGLYYPETAIDLIHQHPNLVVTRSFSKAVGLAAARLGLAIGSREMISALHAFRPMYETNAFAVKAALLALEHTDLIDRNVAQMLEGKTYLENELSKRGMFFHKSFANFVNIRVGSPEVATSIVNNMREKNILIACGSKDGPLADCIRVSVGTKEQMERVLIVLDQKV